MRWVLPRLRVHQRGSRDSSTAGAHLTADSVLSVAGSVVESYRFCPNFLDVFLVQSLPRFQTSIALQYLAIQLLVSKDVTKSLLITAEIRACGA